jgi:hypothetical protein
MEYFGLKSLSDLPKLEEFPNLQPAYEKEENIINPEGIPMEAVAVNSLEQIKQQAIARENLQTSSAALQAVETMEEPSKHDEGQPNES